MGKHMSEIEESLAEIKAGNFVALEHEWQIFQELLEIWSSASEENVVRESSVFYGVKEPKGKYSTSESKKMEWALLFSNTFRKAISIIDMKLKGKVMSAIAELSKNPITPHGDTRKPLSGGQKGCWRYRLGDYRLVYKPNKDTRTVSLLDFEARGDIYH